MADVFKRCAQRQGDLHVCIDPTHENPHKFPTLRDLKKHVRSHIPYEHLPHQCVEDGCSWRFLFLKDLKRHRKAHAGPGDECPQCNKILSRSDNLARHISRLHPNTPFAEVTEGLNESLGGSMSPEVLSAPHDRKDLKSRRSKKPRMEIPDDILAGEAMDEDSNIDPMLRAPQHPANDTTASFSFASTSSHTDTPSASGVPSSARSTEGNRRRLRRQETGGSSRDSEQSQSTDSSRSSRKRKSRCATLTAPSSVVSGLSEGKHVDEGSKGIAGRNPSLGADCNSWDMLANEEGQV
ncbi:hypothetical protein KC332_g4440 [Hortaea werneckii]|uniref:C2H2-type domain-containing protein n=2 Tax=Hortaea werneckii TaxID=91943 RepID=A0A3M7GFW2_HORWE|nr:hypothetical protein KC350_g6029 [Hortaea werneckii]OTA31256.1 hypothetical protein BTJ68_09132 [Hortaea werneckii EXF-2000]KAI6839215.1 hypothetical protein KC358_g4715 [Hortaea werneckii]KAI6933898.1 hypothetical protein KC341_g7974 [Hortaea werneckii]KAI6944336.1 hypothetical protein KC348_g3984 [Hortaea werneckii]